MVDSRALEKQEWSDVGREWGQTRKQCCCWS